MTYKYLNNETNEWEEIQPEAWRWEVAYHGGDVLRQFDDNGIFHRFGEIDQGRLFAIRMVHDSHSPHTVMVPEGAKLIHFYRNIIANASTPDEFRVRLYCFGYEKNGVTVICVIMPNGEIVVTDEVSKIQIKAGG